MSKGKLTWKSQELPGGIRVDVADGVPVNQGVFEGKSYANQRLGPAALAVSLGPTVKLDDWRALFKATPTLSAETKITVCGRDAVRQEATFAAGPYSTDLKDDGEGHTVEEEIDHPAMTEVAVTFAHGGANVLAVWRVETAQRSAWSADEAHFFAAISCK